MVDEPEWKKDYEWAQAHGPRTIIRPTTIRTGVPEEDWMKLAGLENYSRQSFTHVLYGDGGIYPKGSEPRWHRFKRRWHTRLDRLRDAWGVLKGDLEVYDPDYD